MLYVYSALPHLSPLSHPVSATCQFVFLYSFMPCFPLCLIIYVDSDTASTLHPNLCPHPASYIYIRDPLTHTTNNPTLVGKINYLTEMKTNRKYKKQRLKSLPVNNVDLISGSHIVSSALSSSHSTHSMQTVKRRNMWTSVKNNDVSIQRRIWLLKKCR